MTMTPATHGARLAAGIGNALAAGLAWGLVFVAPVLLPDYPPTLLAFGRYLAFGLIAVPLAWRDRFALARLSRADWVEALKLAAVGNVLYYLSLSAAIQQAGVPLPTMIIGTLPVVIAVCSNLSRPELAWARLAPSLALIAAGIGCVNLSELRHLEESGASRAGFALGAALAVAALACWTWYPIRNARWMQCNPQASPGTWATAQGLATLPLAVAGMAGTLLWTGVTGTAGLPGPRPLEYAGLMLAIGLLASWLGTRWWNRASQLLPTSLVGQLIVFETLSALAYGFLHRGDWPDAVTWAGIGLLVAGVVAGTRAFRPAAAPA